MKKEPMDFESLKRKAAMMIKWKLGTGVTIDNAAYGMYLLNAPLNAEGNTVTNSHNAQCHPSQPCGAVLYSTDNANTSDLLVLNCEFYDNARVGVHVYRGSGANVRGCIFDNSPTSILSVQTTDFNASGNTISTTVWGAIVRLSTAPGISANSFTNCWGALQSEKNVMPSYGNNDITTAYFMRITSNWDDRLRAIGNEMDNDAVNNGIGILVLNPLFTSAWGNGFPAATIENNTISHVRRGITLLNSNFSMVRENIIHVREIATGSPPAAGWPTSSATLRSSPQSRSSRP